MEIKPFTFSPLPDNDSLGTLEAVTSLGSTRLQWDRAAQPGGRGSWWDVMVFKEQAHTHTHIKKKHLCPLAG